MLNTGYRESIKTLRKTIDACIQDAEAEIFAVQDQGVGANTSKTELLRSLALVRTKLQEAKMWAGQSLGELGFKLPEEYQDTADD